MIEERKPVEELAFILEKFGWDTKFCDLTEDQVYTLIFGLQAAKDISSEIEIGKLEENYFKSTGTWPPRS